MARKLRIFLDGVACHVVQRGNDRSAIFRSTQDYKLFLRLLADAARRFDLQIHAYVLMTNHVHLLATPNGAESMPAAMQAIGRRYVPYFNRRYERTGALFEGRYRSTFVASESYVMTCMRYIELNPVRAGLSATPDSYRWSSYKTHGFGLSDPLVTSHDVYRRLGRRAQERCRHWRDFCAHQVSADDLDRVRRDLKTGGSSPASVDRSQP